ncbi:hypothetical protein VQH23_02765 [Pararoseomonas sp. SCSIO 73927]|uniref:hypothetical protein n=1 Tax=Pararoseomonas sp. SCSIO 73927 TaxID=3114537 RepID=UPI0030CD7B07
MQSPTNALRGFLRAVDLIPYLAVLAVPLAWAAWVMGLGGNATREEVEASLWLKGYLATLLFVPAMIACGVLEWLTHRFVWPRARIAIRLFRWVHVLIVFGPVIAFAALLALPASWRPF